ncbi:helix-turn-helix domain-containing protein [Burkholderia vietnamiensis]|uniref:helix-turn-helix domain-containing protein n=1 Tax=Burkholderia vietnamiensis TaxID=60552 RepID=UPI001B9840CC|nr:helix-turn-helix transcriptional regulator [Burkholderia vietnamiensis]MBR8361361.1 helix-turn-helix domain-containing protein [Burkholderia vietnamiensis]
MANLEAVTTSGAILGQVLVKLRTSIGLKQHELAEGVGVSASTWSRIEKGDSGLSIDQLRAAAKALGVSAALILQMVEEAEKEVKSRGIDVKATWSVGPISGVAAGMATGAALGGVVLPVIGSALGGLVGGVVAHLFSKEDDDDK